MATATAVGTWIAANWGAVAAAASVAGSVYSATGTTGGDTPTVLGAPQITDKTTAEKAELLDEVQIGDEETAKRKKLATKSKFKQALIPDDTTTGLNAPAGNITGVQI